MAWNRPKRKAPIPQPPAKAVTAENPLFPTKVSPLRQWRQSIIIAILIILSGVAIGLTVYGPWYDVTDIRITGAKKIDPQSVQRATNEYLRRWRFYIWPNRNLLLLSTGDLRQYLLNLIQQRLSIDALSVQKQFPHAVTISIAERVPVAIFSSTEQSAVIDRHGVVIAASIPAESTTLFKIHDLNNTPIVVGQHVLAEDVVNAIRQLSSLLTASAIEVNEFQLPLLSCPAPIPDTNRPVNAINGNMNTNSPANANTSIPTNINTNTSAVGCDPDTLRQTRAEIHVLLKSNILLLFDRFQPLASAVQNVKRILSSPEQQPQEYIDVRFGERVFIK